MKENKLIPFELKEELAGSFLGQDKLRTTSEIWGLEESLELHHKMKSSSSNCARQDGKYI